MPHRVAIALQDSGWWVRDDIVWNKKNPMPGSMQDRCTKAHEYIFQLANSRYYFCDMYAIREKTSGTAHARGNGVNPKCAEPSSGIKQNSSFSAAVAGVVETRNPRSVWTVGTEPFSEAHFATFPPSIPERCIKAGTSEKGQCAKCHKPYTRILKPSESYAKFLGKGFHDHDADEAQGFIQMRGENRQNACRDEGGHGGAEYETVGWSTNGKGRDRSNGNRTGWEGCECGETETVPQVVLDCFGGAGTTGLVAKRLGRRAILIELNPEYCDLIKDRLIHWHKKSPPKKVDHSTLPLLAGLMEVDA